MSRERGAQASTLSGVLVQINVLGLSLKTFGIVFALVFALVFVAVGAILARRLKELGKPVDYAYEMAFAALVGGLVGARLYYVVQNYSQVKNDLVGSVAVADARPVPSRRPVLVLSRALRGRAAAGGVRAAQPSRDRRA